MHGNIQSHTHDAPILPLENFNTLQQRYQALDLASRAAAALKDAEPALRAADHILSSLTSHPKIKHVFEAMQKNGELTGKMRPCEARNVLMDGHADFIDMTRRKLQAWRKTMERIGDGEGIIRGSADMEYIPGHAPVALAYACITTAGAYLAIVQLALAELAKIDGKYAAKHLSNVARIRRCATLISDCESASAIGALVH